MAETGKKPQKRAHFVDDEEMNSRLINPSPSDDNPLMVNPKPLPKPKSEQKNMLY